MSEGSLFLARYERAVVPKISQSWKLVKAVGNVAVSAMASAGIVAGCRAADDKRQTIGMWAVTLWGQRSL
jgi:hypothetical protein